MLGSPRLRDFGVVEDVRMTRKDVGVGCVDDARDDVLFEEGANCGKSTIGENG
jgi:hypothetical protein